jgi:hypothetical protein
VSCTSLASLILIMTWLKETNFTDTRQSKIDSMHSHNIYVLFIIYKLVKNNISLNNHSLWQLLNNRFYSYTLKKKNILLTISINKFQSHFIINISLHNYQKLPLSEQSCSAPHLKHFRWHADTSIISNPHLMHTCCIFLFFLSWYLVILFGNII